MLKDYHESVYDCTISVWSPEGREIETTKPEWKLPGVEHAAPNVNVSFLKRRAVLTQMLLDQCRRFGIPVHMMQQAVAVDESESGVTVRTINGHSYTGDLCIAADGLDSIASEHTGDVQDTGYATARVAFPRRLIKPNSPAESLLRNADAGQPEFRVYMAHDLHNIVFLTRDWVAFAFTHPSVGADEESWHNFVDTKPLIALLEQSGDTWDPAVLDLIRQNPYKVVDWKLRSRDSDPQWTSPGGRIIRIGDAAHAFLPTSGNGAVQALEDAISLAECLRLGGKENIGWSTKVHNQLRHPRTTILQQAGFVNREELHANDLSAIAKDGGGKIETGFFKMGAWVWKHDPERYAWEYYSACLSHLREGTPFVNTNLPPGHVFRPWTMKGEMERMRRGQKSGLKGNGYWGF